VRRGPRYLAGVGLVAIAALGGSACSSTAPYAAKVNGSVISRADINSELSAISANSAYVKLVDSQQGGTQIEGTAPGTYNSAFVADVLTQQIEYQLIRDELKRRNALPGADAIAAAQTDLAQRYTTSQDQTPGSLLKGFPASYRQTLVERQAWVTALRNVVGNVDTSAASLRAYYNAHPEQFASQVCIRHILVADKNAAGQIDYNASQAKALAIETQLAQGADFAALAQASSADAQSAQQGGSLGCVTQQDIQGFVPEFAAAVNSLPVNHVSDPVRSQFGYHLIEVTARTIPPYSDQLASQVKQAMTNQAQQAFLSKLYAMASSASVKVNPEFGTWNPKADPSTGQGPHVVPPTAPNPPMAGVAPSAQAAAAGG
jgi:parvulin-like peptidyl-prolyl isomerase